MAWKINVFHTKNKYETSWVWSYYYEPSIFYKTVFEKNRPRVDIFHEAW